MSDPSTDRATAEAASSPTVGGRGPKGRRRWIFRLLAIGVGLLPLLLAELVLAAIGLGGPEREVDPFVGFSELRPLFVRNREGTRFEIPPVHYKFFRPESFGATKEPGEFRVFCLGGSTVQGRPFQVETSFTTWLELGLNAADPSRRWEVVNCGGVSYASYRLVPVLREVLDRYEPDLIVLYTGQNEFLEDRTYRRIKRTPEPVRRLLAPLAGLRTYRALRGGLERLSGPDRRPAGSTLGPEVDAILDYEGGLEAYRRDDDWREAVVAHYAYNVERMVRMAGDRGVPIVLADPVANLETAPFKSENRPGITTAEVDRFEALWEEAREYYGDDLPHAVALLEEARSIDGRHAGLHYTLGKCYQQLGRLDEARASLIRAKDEDVCPLRVLEPMRAAVRSIAEEAGAPVLDAWGLIAARSEGAIPGNAWLVDHVHPSIRGHQLLADALLDLMAAEGIVRPTAGWESRRDRPGRRAPGDARRHVLPARPAAARRPPRLGRRPRRPPPRPERPAPAVDDAG